MSEQWKVIDGYPHYEVSSLGRVRSNWHPNPLILEQRRNPQAPGYMQVELTNDAGRRKSWKVHKLVTAAFLGPRPDGLVTRHLNGDPTDNRLPNLAYGTVAENRQDTIAHGNDPWLRRTHCINGHEWTPENTGRRKVTPSSEHRARYCKACRRLIDKRRREASKRGAA